MGVSLINNGHLKLIKILDAFTLTLVFIYVNDYVKALIINCFNLVCSCGWYS